MKPRLLLIKPTNSSFITVDEQALRHHFRLSSLYLRQEKGGLGYLFGIVWMLVRILLSFKSKAVLVWFADYHALPAVLMARLTGKKSVVFVGGYDAVCYPEFGYGVYCKYIRGFCAKHALKISDLIIANDEALLSSDNWYYNPQGHPEGVLRLVKGLSTSTLVIPNAPLIKAPESVCDQRMAQILCVGGTPRFEDIYNKGYDLLFGLARLRPDLQIVIIGINPAWMSRLEDEFQLSDLKNLLLSPPLPHSEVLQIMLQSEIYVQPSISEGMPNALMEAMLCGCIPVGSNVAGIPKLIGNWGVVFHERKSECLLKAIDEARQLQLDPETISSSITLRYSISRRASELKQAIGSILLSSL